MDGLLLSFRCLLEMPSREQEGQSREAGLRRCLGRVQSFIPLLLHVTLGQAEQSMSTLPEGMVHPEDGKVANHGDDVFL